MTRTWNACKWNVCNFNRSLIDVNVAGLISERNIFLRRGLFLSLFLVVFGFGVARVDELRVMFVHQTYQSFSFQFLKGEAGERASNLQPLGNNGRRDQLVRRHFFVQFVVSGLIKEDEIVELVTDFSLGPLLLLGLSSAIFLGRSLGWFRFLLRGHFYQSKFILLILFKQIE